MSRPVLLRAALRAALATTALATTAGAQPARRPPPLGSADIDDLARLVLLEDRRAFDDSALTRLLAAPHPEVRRRAAVTVARLADARGVALLRARPLDADTAIAAATVFAVGQLRDSGTVAWLDSLLASPRTAPTVATEAAAGLGKIKTAAARAALARYLASAVASARTRATIGEALLAIGRAIPRGDLAPIVRWTRSADEEIRWRATWALFRPRDPASVAPLLALSADRSALVRSWAVRGLARAQADSAGLAVRAESTLLAAALDGDRRVRTEALRALGTYADSAALVGLMGALGSSDTWLSVTAAEGLGALARTAPPGGARAVAATSGSGALARVAPTGGATATAEAAAAAIDLLVGATRAGKPCALRVTALRALQPVAAADAATAAEQVARDTVPFCGTAATQVQQALARAAAAAAGGERPAAQNAGPRARPPRPERPLAEYRAIVERWIVPDYQGRPRPRAVWETPRGALELELYPGDAPLAVDDFVRSTESGAIVGTEFTRVVPDFVNQQRPVTGGTTLRDEVNRYRLTRGNLSWATAGLDTGTPGYTLGHTPQPHNEGDFTSVGRVVRGMAVVDRIELGDRVTGARMLPVGASRPTQR